MIEVCVHENVVKPEHVLAVNLLGIKNLTSKEHKPGVTAFTISPNQESVQIP